jgi:ubiquinol-cytochrome c reductase cytochrome c1 subunit
MKNCFRNSKLFLLFFILFQTFHGLCVAAESSVALDSFPSKKMNDMAALQNGSKLFMNYCAGCHGISQVRYGRLKDLGLTKTQIKNNLVLNTKATLASPIVASMKKTDSKEWFGKAPPDLSLTARSRSSGAGSGADWIYTYLRSYYKDPDQPTGWNNLVYPGVGMPHVLWEMQGIKKASFTEELDHGVTKIVFDKFVTEKSGDLSKAEFDNNIADLTAFMVWVAEPAGQFRKRLGVWVILFLSFFVFVAWRLNAAYWKDIK